MRSRAATGLLVALMLAVGGCGSGDPTASDEYLALETELVDAQAALVVATTPAEGGPTATEPWPDSENRRASAEAILAEITLILHDPEAYGSEEDIADLLASHATPEALMDDAVFGAVDYRTGFYNTLYSGLVDAKIDVYHSWVSSDGSQGGVLWMWHGANAAGNPFALAGISLTEHDEDGLISYELVAYPYPDEYVDNAVFGSGT